MGDYIKKVIKRLIPLKYHEIFRLSFIRLKYFLFFFYYNYRGSKFECPFCNKHFRKLLPSGKDLAVLREKEIIGGCYNPEAMCPYCYSSDRERLIYLYLREKTKVFDSNIRLLHVAPERNLQKVLKNAKNIHFLSIDINSPIAMVRMDIRDIKYRDNLFDVIICNHVLEHIHDDDKAMKELYRVLKPGGWAILQVPISLSLDKTYEDFFVTGEKEREEIFGQADHFRIYARDYKDRLENAGFCVRIDNLTEKDSRLRYGLTKEEDIYIGFKRQEVGTVLSL